MNSKAVGELSEGMILARLLQLGYPVSIPFGNNQRYDMIVEENGKFLRAQCKTGRISRNCVSFTTCSTNGFTGEHRSYHGQIDIFLVYCPINGNVYRIPVDKAGAQACNLRLIPAKNNQRSGVNLAVNFQI